MGGGEELVLCCFGLGGWRGLAGCSKWSTNGPAR